MKTQDYNAKITVRVAPEEAFKHITRVSDWWTNSLKGGAEHLNDAFTVTFGETTVAFKVVETIPGKKLVWLVTDCHLHWLKNMTEWKNTRVVWNISKSANGSEIEMTHIGLVPGIECYKDCEAGWNQYVKESLPKLIATGEGVVFEGKRG